MAVRGRRGKPPGSGGARRRAPQEYTGKEADYLLRQKESRVPMKVTLLDGTIVHGVIEYFDRDMLKLTRPEGPHFFVRKSDIRYMEKEEPND